jgi:hypothetical protein
MNNRQRDFGEKHYSPQWPIPRDTGPQRARNWIDEAVHADDQHSGFPGRFELPWRPVDQLHESSHTTTDKYPRVYSQGFGTVQRRRDLARNHDSRARHLPLSRKLPTVYPFYNRNTTFHGPDRSICPPVSRAQAFTLISKVCGLP